MFSSHIITGQTATGKTSRALTLAKQVNGYIISADSRQIYSQLDIITGKDIEDRSTWTSVDGWISESGKEITMGYYLHDGIMICGLDCITPDTHFSVYEYCELVQHIMSHTIVKDLTPIVVGGTYLYIKALLYGLDATSGPSWDLRDSLSDLPLAELQEKLQQLAPTTWESLNNSERNNPQRLIRKIEIAMAGGADANLVTSPILKAISYIGLEHQSADSLLAAITTRVQSRIKTGAKEEVEKILAQGYTSISPGLKTPGYQEIIQHLEGKLTWEQAVEKWIRSEVQYAKRQKTFMKKDENVNWLTS
jgi:tRNA dimethylallyltransferase